MNVCSDDENTGGGISNDERLVLSDVKSNIIIP